MVKKWIPYTLLVCLFVTLLGGCTKEPEMLVSPPAEKEGYVLDWQDEFNGNDLDPRWWLAHFGYSTCSKARMVDYEVSKGTLKLRIQSDHPTRYNNFVTKGFKVSGIETYSDYFDVLYINGREELDEAYEGYVTKYGYFEIRCKIPSDGGGGHVAFWMRGTDHEGDPQTCEIDILESKFTVPNYHQPKLFAWGDETLKDWRDAYIVEGDVINEWHTYAMDWRPEYVAFYVDGIEVLRTEQSPQYEMYIILSLYINDEPGSLYWDGMPSDVYPKEWEIDYIRAYKDVNGYE